MSKRTIKNNSNSKEFEKAKGKCFFSFYDVDNDCEGDKSLHNKERSSKKIKLRIDPNVEIFKMFIDRVKEDGEKEGNAVVDNSALKEAARQFNDAMLDELQDRLKRQASVYDRVVETLFGELNRLRGRIKELENSLLEKDEVLDDVIEELADKERQLSAVRDAVGYGVDVKCDEL
jgi:chromosome segregation ATPase